MELGGLPELDRALEMVQVLKPVWVPELDGILELVCALQGERGFASSRALEAGLASEVDGVSELV